jgi:hypothetical protein
MAPLTLIRCDVTLRMVVGLRLGLQLRRDRSHRRGGVSSLKNRVLDLVLLADLHQLCREIHLVVLLEDSWAIVLILIFNY